MRTEALRVALVAVAAAIGCDVPAEIDGQPDQADGTGDIIEESQLKQVIGDTASGGGPGGAIIAGIRYLTYIGTDGRVNILKHLGGSNWRKIIVNQKAKGASLSHWEGWFTLVTVGDGVIDVRTSGDGITWPDGDTFGFSLGCKECLFTDPALVVTNNVLHAFVSYNDPFGTRNKVSLYLVFPDELFMQFVGSLTDVVSAQPISVTRANVDLSIPADLALHWVGGDGRLNIKRYLHPQGWTQPISRPWSGTPHVVKTASGYMMASRSTGNIGPNQISFYSSSDGENWSWRANSVHTTSRRPFLLSATNNFVEFTHTGTDSAKTVNYNTQSF
jgi:hypothetical protein